MTPVGRDVKLLGKQRAGFQVRLLPFLFQK
jgi:hypothetical protein